VNKLNALFEPIKIGSLEIKNRLMLSAMGTKFLQADGICNDRLAQYLITRAKGGWGLIVTEMTRVSGDSHISVAGIYNEEQVKSFQPVVAEVHRYRARIFMQLFHPGRRDSRVLRDGEAPIAPSAIGIAPNSEIPREMTTAEVWQMVDAFANAAANAKKAGFDGVEIHCGHGWLLSAFLSPISNKRVDEFGGSIAGRSKLVIEIIKAIKKKCGCDFPVTMKLTVQEYVDGGLGLEEVKTMAWLFEKAGIDAIHCTQGIMLSNETTNPPSCTPRAFYLENALAIKSVVHVPVIAVGRINDPDLAERILETTEIDMISMARASLADPDFPRKVQENQTSDIIRCVGCLQMCLGAKPGAGIGCMLNPKTGKEYLYQQKQIAEAKKVAVIGGGVSGCAAAIAAAENGHHVTLYEQDSVLGGQWLAARVPVGKEEFGSFLQWQRQRLEKLGVKIFLNQMVTAELLLKQEFDVVIAATGGNPIIPPIKGATTDNVVMANDVLLGKKTVGKQVVVIGGGLVGTELADQIAFYGSQVCVVEMADAIAKDAVGNARTKLLERLAKRQVQVFTKTKVVEIVCGKVIAVDSDGTQIEIPADTIVMAVGSKPNNLLATQLKEHGSQVKVVGDAAKVKMGSENIAEGFIAGYEID